MPMKISTTGVQAILDDLRWRSKKTAQEGNPRMEVGYSADYSMYVHENLAIVHVNGQAKFLEEPLKKLQGELQTMVRDNVHKGMSLRKALQLAGARLLSASQKLVPVRTGYLRSSGYVRVS